MRNLKKIVAVIMAVAMIASMMVPALAAGVANETQAQALKNVGLFKGVSDTDLGLANNLPRIQAMTLVIRAKGQDAAALALTQAEIDEQLAKVADASTIPSWGKAYAAFALKTGITNGVGRGGKVYFDTNAKVDGKTFVTLTLRAMGYANVDFANPWETAVKAGLASAVSLGFKASLVRDDAVGVLYAAVKSGVNADGKTLIQALIDAKAVDQKIASDNGFCKAPAPVGLKIESATALNLKQIQVVFNKPVNTDDAKDISKYEVKDKGSDVVAVSGAAIAADGKTVTLTLGVGDSVKLTNNSTAKVTVKKDFRDADGTKISEDLSFSTITVADTVFPNFDKVEAVGLKTLRLYFSEPVKSVPTDAFSVKAGSYTWTYSVSKIDDAGKYVEITLGTNLLEGNVDVKVGTNKVFDFAGNMVFEKTITYAFAKVATAPTASIDSAKPGEIKVKFDRPVYGTIDVSHGVKGYEAYTVSKTAIDSAAADSWTFDFSNKKVPAGTITIFVTPNGDVKDLYGNKFVATSFSVTAVSYTHL
ncbi:MAG: Ig-like domain-containing protein, partial [Clostridia bacterium]|nr:Ig-like domain-containing protein [Clostridia bacterium]